MAPRKCLRSGFPARKLCWILGQPCAGRGLLPTSASTLLGLVLIRRTGYMVHPVDRYGEERTDRLYESLRRFRETGLQQNLTLTLL